MRAQRSQRKCERQEELALGEGENEEIAPAGDDYGEETAVGGDGEIADGEAVKDHVGLWLRNGDVVILGSGGKGREIDPDEVAGFFFDSAFEENAGLVGRPVKDAEADANAGQVIGRSKIANFENFLVDKIGDFFPAGGDAQASFVAVECRKLFVFVD